MTLPSKAIYVFNIRNLEKLVLQNLSQSVKQGVILIIPCLFSQVFIVWSIYNYADNNVWHSF